MNRKKWNAEMYEQSCSFVYQYGSSVTDLIKPTPNMRLLDVGCGSGALTAELADKLAAVGGSIVGVDASEEMLALARTHYPQLDFRQADAVSLPFQEEFDAVFSNAVFHWINTAEGQRALLHGISRALKPDGQLCCEFGGFGCGANVHNALRKVFASKGLDYSFPFYFPTIGQYAPLVEEAGLLLTDAFLFDRPTLMEGADGLEKWIRMFVTAPFAGLSEEDTLSIIAQAVELLKPGMYDGENWTIDYVRIRLRAVKRN